MYCPEHKVFGSAFLWVYMYWRDVPRETIPLRVWMNPLNYEVSVYWPPFHKSPNRDRIATLNRNGQWIRNRIYLLKITLQELIYLYIRRPMSRVPYWIAAKMPRWLVYHCTIRCAVHASGSRYPNQCVPELTVMEALKRWEAQRE